MKLGLLLVVLAATIALNACSSHDDVSLRLTVEHFRDCGQLRDYLGERRNAYESELSRERDEKSGTPTTDLAGTADASHVNLQESGVDEADYFRVSEKFFYFARAHRVEVVDRATLRYVGALDVRPLENVRLFTAGTKLVVLGDHGPGTEARFYVESASGIPTLQMTFPIEARLRDARLVKRRLVLLLGSDADMTPMALEASGCANVTVPFVNDADFSYSRIETIDIDHPGIDGKTLFALGISGHLYMTPDTIYLAKEGVRWPTRDWEHFVVAKITFNADNGDVAMAAVGGVRGYAKDQWAFKEFKSRNAIAVATTDFSRSNHLWVLQQNGERLDLVGGVHDFGRNETIRAIRYVGNMAYVVTFESTDPLFVIDLSEPLIPVLKGELVIPGFSTYLHPAAGGKLVGVGYGQFVGPVSSLQVSLFDVSAPSSPRRLDNRELGDNSYSEANWDHHAFYFDDTRQIVGVPAVDIQSGGYQAGPTLSFSGALLYHVGSALTERARLTHRRWIPVSCANYVSYQRMIDINRLAAVDGALFSASRFGLIAHDIDDPTRELASVRYPEIASSELCPTPQYEY